MSDEKKNQDKAKAKDVVVATDDGLAAKVRKLEDAVKGLNHFKQHILDFAGKMGFALPKDGNARMGVLISIAAAALTAVVMAETVTFPIFDQTTYGNGKFVGDSSTAKTTLTVDNATISSSLTVTNATVNGMVTKGTYSGPFVGFYETSDPRAQVTVQDDFVNASSSTESGALALGGYVVTTNEGSVAGATLNIAGNVGELQLAIPSNSVNHSVSLAYGLDGDVAPINLVTNSGKKVAVEFRVKLADTNYQNTAFVGLMSQTAYAHAKSAATNLLDNNTGLFTGSTNHDFFGFHVFNTGTVARTWRLVGNSVLSNGVVATSISTTATENYIKLGFLFDGTSTVTPYVDSVPNSSTITWVTNTYPVNVQMTPVIFFKNLTNKAFTVHAPYLYVDYLKVMQDR